MVDEERLREWVEQKLDEGIDPERIKKTLENTGRDPSIVDDVIDPFQDQEERPEPEPIKPENDPESDNQGSEVDDSEGFQSSREKQREAYRERGREREEEKEDEDSGFSLPDFSLPSFSLPSFSIPSFSIPDLNINVSWKRVGLILAVLVAAGGVVYGVSSGFPASLGSVALPGLGGDSGSERPAELTEGSCPNVGVRVSSVSVDESLIGGSTEAKVRVSRGEAEVAVELYDSNELVEYKIMTFEGQKRVSFGSVGDEVVIFPTGCEQFYDSMTVN